MNYQFDSEEAALFGVPEAIMISNFRFWILKNRANNKHFYDGRYWTYNSAKALSEVLPFWSDRQIERILANLLKNNILVKANYNKSGYDRTNWYAFSDESIYLKELLHSRKKGNGTPDKGEPIPDSNTDSNTDDKPDTLKECPLFDVFWNAYAKKTGKEDCLKRWLKLKQADKEKILQHVPLYVASTPDTTFRKNPFTYLNKKSWNDEIEPAKDCRTVKNHLTKEEKEALWHG